MIKFKSLVTTLLTMMVSSVASAQTVTNLSILSAEQKAAATNIALTGQLTTRGNSDFRGLRDLCVRLQTVDLSAAECPVIPANALHSCHRLQAIRLPEQVETIGSQAFFACTGLDSLTLPASLKTVGEAAFSNCSQLQALHIVGTPQLASFAFAHCKALKEIRLDSPVPPVANASCFYGISPKTCRLVVPKGSKKAYRKATGWSVFFTQQDVVAEVDSVYIIPVPQELTYTNGERMEWSKVGRIVCQQGLENECEHLRRILHERTTFREGRSKGAISLRTDASLPNTEAYRLTVSAEGIDIVGQTAEGVFRALSTLEQMTLGDGAAMRCASLPALSITDQPRTRMRELMVDPARIFMPLETLKGYVVEMAKYKFNALHLHLVDDQAWRIEIKAYPRLTEIASKRTGMDDMPLYIEGFYTQDEMRELVAFAKKYHVEIIPEIEMPGHEVAAIHCYPQLTCGGRGVPIRTTCGVSNELLCPGEEFVYEFLGNVFAELADVFPSRYVHLGGDEAGNPALDCWTNCAKCRALKQRLGITTTDRSENYLLQQYMFDRVIDTLRTKHNKVPMFWYETDFKRIQEGCITFSWRHGLTNAAIDAAMANGAYLMMCPGEHCYLDYPMAAGDMPEVNWGMPITSLQQTYRLDPAWGRTDNFEQTLLYGVAGTLWSECITTRERLYYMTYPRALALSEAGWSAPEHRSWTGFKQRMRPTLLDMRRRGISHSIAF